MQQRLGVTTIMVTHDQDEALSMADRIVVMDHGVIAQVGSPIEVYRHPNSAFVANFIGTMNLADGHISTQGKVCCGSLEFDCDNNQGASVELRVTLAIRPEDIVLDGSDDGHDNIVTVRVNAVDFLGPFYRLSCAAGTDQAVEVRAEYPRQSCPASEDSCQECSCTCDFPKTICACIWER